MQAKLTRGKTKGAKTNNFSFGLKTFTFNFLAIGSNVFQFKATDLDTLPANKDVIYTLMSGDTDYFRVSREGVLSVNKVNEEFVFFRHENIKLLLKYFCGRN